MPKVGKKNFPYTPAGEKAAKKEKMTMEGKGMKGMKGMKKMRKR